MGADSAALGSASPVGMPACVEREVAARRESQPPAPTRSAREPEVRVPAERDRHAAAPGGDDRRVDAQRGLPDGRGDLDAVWERERGRIHRDGRSESCGVAAGREPVDLPAAAPDEESVDREPVVVDGEVEPVERRR